MNLCFFIGGENRLWEADLGGVTILLLEARSMRDRVVLG